MLQEEPCSVQIMMEARKKNKGEYQKEGGLKSYQRGSKENPESSLEWKNFCM